MHPVVTARRRWVNYLAVGWVNFLAVGWVNFLAKNPLPWVNYLAAGWVNFLAVEALKWVVCVAVDKYAVFPASVLQSAPAKKQLFLKVV